MDREKTFEKLFEPINLNPVPKSSDHTSQNEDKSSFLELKLGIEPYSSDSKRSQQDDVDVNNAVVAKKSQKAVYEKLRRDKLNEHFQDLGNVIDSDRHKNDEASIVISAIQALKDLISEVSRLQSEHATLSQESNETLENNELREEKTSQRSDIGTLKVQYHQTRFIPPWPPIDPSVGMTRPFSYPVALSVPSRPFPMCSPPLQPMPFFGNQSAVPSDPGPMIILYPTPATPYINQPSTLNVSSSYICSKEVCENGHLVKTQLIVVRKVMTFLMS